MEKKVSNEGKSERGVAKRIYIADMIQNRGSELDRSNSERLTKVKIFGTVISKRHFRSEGKAEYEVLSIDDGSGLMVQIKAWGNDTKLFDMVEPGNLIDVVGKVRYGTDQIYVVPEIVTKADDPNWEIVRELEIIEDYLRRNKAELRKQEQDNRRPSNLKSEILEMVEIADGNNGIEYSEIIKCLEHSSEDEIKKALRELLIEGLICEIRPGRYRK